MRTNYSVNIFDIRIIEFIPLLGRITKTKQLMSPLQVERTSQSMIFHFKAIQNNMNALETL